MVFPISCQRQPGILCIAFYIIHLRMYRINLFQQSFFILNTKPANMAVLLGRRHIFFNNIVDLKRRN